MFHTVASNLPKVASFRIRTALVALIGAVLLAPFMAPSPALAAVALDSEEAAFCTLINNYRATKGLPALLVSENLTKASEWHSTDMATKNYFSHTDSLGRDPFQRMTAMGYAYSTYRGENIAAGHASASATFEQWKVSSGHNANMLNGNFKVIGIGKATNSAATYRDYWTTNFGGVVDPGAVPCPGSGSATSAPAPAPARTVTVGDISLVEGTSVTAATKAFTFTVRISSASTQSVKVNYATSNGSAASGSDYTATTGTVTIPAGSTSATIIVRVVKDRVREVNETFNLNLSAPVNATIGDGLAIGTIKNDD